MWKTEFPSQLNRERNAVLRQKWFAGHHRATDGGKDSLPKIMFLWLLTPGSFWTKRWLGSQASPCHLSLEAMPSFSPATETIRVKEHAPQKKPFCGFYSWLFTIFSALGDLLLLQGNSKGGIWTINQQRQQQVTAMYCLVCGRLNHTHGIQ